MSVESLLRVRVCGGGQRTGYGVCCRCATSIVLPGPLCCVRACVWGVQDVPILSPVLQKGAYWRRTCPVLFDVPTDEDSDTRNLSCARLSHNPVGGQRTGYSVCCRCATSIVLPVPLCCVC
jgi:hypothetical protein